MSTTMTERPRLKLRYDAEVKAQLFEQLGVKNIHQVPTDRKSVV